MLESVVHNVTSSGLETTGLKSSLMLASHLSDNLDRIQSAIRGQNERNHLKSLGVFLDYFSENSLLDLGKGLEMLGNLNLNGSASSNDSLILNKTPQNTEGIMDGPLGLVENQLRGASDENGRGDWLVNVNVEDFWSVWKDNILGRGGFSREFLTSQIVRMSNGNASQCLADEWNVSSLDVSNNHDLLLRQEVNGQVINGVSQNWLLDENDIGASLDYLLDDLHNVLSLLLENLVDLSIVRNDHIILHVGLWGRNAELKHCDFWVENFAWGSRGCNGPLGGKDDSLEELNIVHGSAQFLKDFDVVQVDIGVSAEIADWLDCL